MIPEIPIDADDRIQLYIDAINEYGVFVVENVLSNEKCEYYKTALDIVAKKITEEVGEEKIERALNYGDNSMRLMMRYHPAFIEILEIPILVEVVDNLLSEQAILKFQHGFIRRANKHYNDANFTQRRFHMNSRQFHGPVMTSVDIGFFFDDEVSEDVPHFSVCPGSHRIGAVPKEELEGIEEPSLYSKGSMFVFDSTLWHRETQNRSKKDSYGCFLQFTMPYIKQHIDLVRALGDDFVLAQQQRTRIFLGWDSRVPTSLEEFYVPTEERLYKSGQP